MSNETRLKIAERMRESWRRKPSVAVVEYGPKRRRGALRKWKGMQFGYGATEEDDVREEGGGRDAVRNDGRKRRVSKGHVDEGRGKQDLKDWEGLLAEVREGRRPPEAVKKAMRDQKRVVGQTETKKLAKKEVVMEACMVCEGAGLIQCPVCAGDDPFRFSGCENCKGTGAVWCSSCKGSGEVPVVAV